MTTKEDDDGFDWIRDLVKEDYVYLYDLKDGRMMNIINSVVLTEKRRILKKLETKCIITEVGEKYFSASAMGEEITTEINATFKTQSNGLKNE